MREQKEELEPLTADEHWNSQCQDLQCFAAEQQPPHGSTPMRSHDNQIAALLLGGGNDGLGWMLLLHVQGGTRDSGSFRSLTGGRENRNGKAGRTPQR